MLAYRPNSQAERLLAIGSEQGAFLYDGDIIANITPSPFTPGIGSSLPSQRLRHRPLRHIDLRHAAPGEHEQPNRRFELVVRHVRAGPARALQLRRQILQV
jgi:hypothetical protein